MPDVLLRALLDGALFSVLVWASIRALPRLTPAVRAMLWWFAAARFAISLVALPPVPLAVLPAGDAEIVAEVAQIGRSAPLAAPPAAEASFVGLGAPVSRWSLVLVSWMAGVGLSMALGARRWNLRRRIVKASTVAPPATRAMTEEIARILRLGHVPQVRMSTAVESPLVTGPLWPVILLPAARFQELPVERQRMAICHELAHVKRGDLWLGLVPAAVERLFFFHPLARLSAREYGFWREVACDRAVLDALGAAPQNYGRLLLDLGVATERRTLAAAGAAWSFSSLKRRIVMLQAPSTPTLTARLAAAGAITAAIIGLLPLRLVARPAAPVPPPQSAHEPVAQPSKEPSGGDEIEFAFIQGDRTMMSGSTRDLERARRMRKAGEDLLWFRKNGKEYVVRDAGILSEVRNLWAPVSRIGTEQGAIGEKQGAIGVRQGEIGVRQAEIGVKQSEIGSRQAALAARQAALAARQAGDLSESDRTEIERRMRALDDDMRALDREMRVLGDRMRELDNPMADLGREMDVLGREMDALGEKMDEASARAEAGMRVLFDRAIAGGAAQLVR